MAEARKPNLPRLITLFLAFIGCVVTVLPLVFPVGANPDGSGTWAGHAPPQADKARGHRGGPQDRVQGAEDPLT